MKLLRMGTVSIKEKEGRFKTVYETFSRSKMLNRTHLIPSTNNIAKKERKIFLKTIKKLMHTAPTVDETEMKRTMSMFKIVNAKTIMNLRRKNFAVKLKTLMVMRTKMGKHVIRLTEMIHDDGWELQDMKNIAKSEEECGKAKKKGKHI